MIKKYKALILSVLGLSVMLASCADYLESDKYFKDRVTIESVFTKKTYSEEWLAQAFSFLKGRNAEVCSKDQLSNSFCFADDIYYGDRDVAYDPKEGIQLSYNKFRLGEYTENEFDAGWSQSYKGIYQASVAIHNIYMNEDMTEKEILDYRGQARFVRAYYYWLLLKRYGPVPIMPDQGVDYTQSYDDIATPRSSYEEVANHIAAEMLQASKELQYTVRGGDEEIARPTIGAALATRAKALIYAASPLANGNTDAFAQAFVDDEGNPLLSPEYDESKWAKAAAACRDVIELGVYELYTANIRTSANGLAYPATITPPYDEKFSDKNWPEGWANIDPFESYRSVFNGDVNAAQNPELIFTRGENSRNGYAVEAFVDHQLPRYFGGWNCHGMTQKMVDAYYMNDGTDVPGKDKEMLPEEWAATNGKERVTGFTTMMDVMRGNYKPLQANVSLQYANREPRFYASVGYNGSVWHCTNEELDSDRNKQIFYYRGGGNGYLNSQFYLRTGIGIKKWVNPRDTYGNQVWKCDPAIRYADILLLYAEAINELTTTHTVESWNGGTYTLSRDRAEMEKGIHPVRIRAGVPDYSDETYADAAMMRKAIKRERMIELMGEGQRYFDLRRWKDAPREESQQIYGLNVFMDSKNREDFHKIIAVYNLPSTFSDKLYFWPITHSELKRNKRMTQTPGWTLND